MSFKTKLFIGVTACSLAMLVLLANLSYPVLVSFITDSIGKKFPDKVFASYFPPKAFYIARIVGALFIILFSVLFYFYYRTLASLLVVFWKSIRLGASSLFHRIKNDFKDAGKWKYIFLLYPLLILYLQTYEAAIRPFQYDEAWTYNYHIGNNFLSSFILPNNHIFYTVVAYFFNFLPFSHEFSVRLPLLIAGFLSFCLLYYLLRQFLHVFSAWVGAIFFYSSAAVTFYTLYARGYMFVILFAIVLLIASCKWIYSRLRNKDAFLWMFISFVLGMYSVPTAAYFFIPTFFAVICFIWKIDRTKPVLFIRGILISIFILSFLFYPHCYLLISKI